MANIAIPSMAITYRALLSCVLCASTGLSKHGVGVEPLFCLDFWDRGRACARGVGLTTVLKMLVFLEHFKHFSQAV